VCAGRAAAEKMFNPRAPLTVSAGDHCSFIIYLYQTFICMPESYDMIL